MNVNLHLFAVSVEEDLFRLESGGQSRVNLEAGDGDGPTALLTSEFQKAQVRIGFNGVENLDPTGHPGSFNRILITLLIGKSDVDLN